MKKLYSILALLGLLNVFALQLFAQPSQNDQTPILEIRKGSTGTYSVDSATGEQFRWQVIGGKITGGAGAGTIASPSILDFPNGNKSIDVTWDAETTPDISSLTGNIQVQKKTAVTNACPSNVQSWDVALWSNATATFPADNTDSICSSDATAGSITVNFTGAPNFDLDYTVTDLAGTTSNQTVTGITSGSTTITLPANLVNTSSTLDQTYVVTLTRMNDSFTGNGTLLNTSYTITVHPTVNTGIITPASKLTRRP